MVGQMMPNAKAKKIKHVKASGNPWNSDFR